MKRGLRNVAKLMTGTALGQVVAFAAAPVLSRLFTPDEFGVVGVFLSIAAVVGVVAALRLELAIVVPKEDDEARRVMAVALLVVGSVATLVAGVVLLWAGPVASLLGTPALGSLLGVLPLYVGSLGTFQVFNYWSTRVGRFGPLAAAQVTRGVSTAGFQIGLGAAGLGAAGMLAGQVGGQLLATLTLLGRSALGNDKILQTRVSARSAASVLTRYSDFIIFGAPQALINSLSQGVPALVLTSAFGAGIAGQFLLAQRVITAPGNLLGQSLRQVLYPHLSRRLDDPGIVGFVVRITLALGALAVFPAGLLAIFGPSAFEWIFGDEWQLGGVFARYLGLYIVSGLMNIPAVNLVPLLRMQRWHVGYEFVYLVVRVGALVIGGYLWGAVGAVAAISFVGIGFNGILVLSVLLQLRRHALTVGRLREGDWVDDE